VGTEPVGGVIADWYVAMLDETSSPRGMVNRLNNSGKAENLRTPSLSLTGFSFSTVASLRMGFLRSVVVHIIVAERPLLILMSLASLLAPRRTLDLTSVLLAEVAESGREMDPTTLLAYWR
jgi:hypothetical protein